MNMIPQNFINVLKNEIKNVINGNYSDIGRLK